MSAAIWKVKANKKSSRKNRKYLVKKNLWHLLELCRIYGDDVVTFDGDIKTRYSVNIGPDPYNTLTVYWSVDQGYSYFHACSRYKPKFLVWRFMP